MTVRKENEDWGGECYETECPFHEANNPDGPEPGPFCAGFPKNSPEALCLRQES